MAFYRIGEFCKEFGISPETLKYYDRQGILDPVWKDETSYRYYGQYQTVHLAEYYRLSQMGFSLHEAKEIMKSCSLEEVIQKFSERYMNLTQEIQNQKIVCDALGRMTESLRLISSYNESWYLMPMKDMCYVGHYRDKRSSGFTWWKDTTPFPEFWQRVQMDITEDFSYVLKTKTRDWGFLTTREVGEKLPSDALNKMQIESVPDCRAFFYYHSVPAQYDEEKKLSDKVWDFEAPLQLMKKHHLIPRGDFYQQRLCVTQEEAGTMVHMVTQIPLKE